MLEVNGSPYKLSQDEVKIYNKKFKFVVAQRYISLNKAMVPPRVEVGGVTMTCYYRAVDPVTQQEVEVRYFTSKKSDPNDLHNKIYLPTHDLRLTRNPQGHFDSEDMEFNWFFDNSPENEAVRENTRHHNHKIAMKCSQFFSTFNKVKVAERKMFQAGDYVYCINRLTYEGAEKWTFEQCKALANKLINAGTFSHNFYSLEEMTEEEIRWELVRIAQGNPNSMRDAMGTSEIGIGADLQNWEANGVIKFDFPTNQWSYVNTKEETKPLFKTVPMNKDRMMYLVENFKSGALPVLNLYRACQKSYEKKVGELEEV